MRCDYVLFHYEKCAEGIPGVAPPQYAAVGQGVPVKLSHQVFVQISFRILRDRLVFQQQQITAARTAPPGSTQSETTSKERDCVALFLFLRAYLHQMREVAAVVEGRSTNLPKLNQRQPRADGPSPSPSPSPSMQRSSGHNRSSAIPTTQHLRFQLLLEFGVDVQPLLETHNSQDMRTYCFETCMPSEATEDEFLRQMSSASEMAQTCSIM
jgi:hypothetical protein